MFRNYLFVLFALALLPFEMKADWVSVDKSSAPNTPPAVTILSDDNTSTVFRIDISGFNINDLVTENKTYQFLDLLSDVYTTESGSPELPIIAKILAVPDQAGISVEVIETGEVQVFNNISLPPARPSWWEGKPEPAYEENSKAFGSEGIYPQDYVQIDPPSIFRDFRIARVSVFPVRYIAGKREVHIVNSITVRVNYGAGEVINPKTTAPKKIAPSFGKIYRSSILNYESVLEKLYNGKEEGHDLMLCIMPDAFTASFQIYADWKRQSGIDIHITKFSDINANATNPDIIKNHIADAYHNWDVPPTYVLIVGDDGVFPKKIVTYPDYSFPNEDFFVEIDGNDYFPEMMIGRFTNEGDYRMQVMINKFMLYEKNPYIADNEWFKKATMCSNNYYLTQVTTKRFVAEVLLNDGGFTTVDTMMSDGEWGSNCTYDLDDVINAIEDGRSFLNYRGEGWSDGWHANCYQFLESDVSSITNGQKFTFITSIGCGVAMFDTFGGNSFGEEWVEMGSLTAPRGASCFVGPTSNTHTTYNNRIDKGIYVGMFQEGMETPGQALLRGKLFMYNVFGNDYYVGYHYKIYCILGDPSIHIWKQVPQSVNVTHPSTIPVGNDIVEVTVTYATNGQPVENAQVCLTGAEIFVTGNTDAMGKAYLSVTAATPETLMVTVRGESVIPHQDNLAVIQDDIFVEPEGYPVITDLDGNQNGMINPNENCNIAFTLKNWGIQTANNVQATLTAQDTEYANIVTTNAVGFGNIAPSAMITGAPFQFYIHSDCPVGEVITLKLHVTSTSYAWDYYFDVEVTGCILSYDNFVVYDGGFGNQNFRMDPGETVVLVLSIENTGLDNAPGVMGILTSNDPNVTVTDSYGSFGNLALNSQAINNVDYFKVHVSSTCPTGYVVDYSLKLFTQNGNYPYEKIIDIELPVSLSIPTDFTGPDSYGYYAYSSEDSFFEQTPIYNWFEIVGLGTQIIIPDTSDYTETVNLPFNFSYYGEVYNQVRLSTDGWLAFGSGTQLAPINTVLPNFDNVNNMVAVLWDDLYDNMFHMGKLYYYSDIPNHRFIVQWDSISRNKFTSEPVREIFQAMLLDPAYYTTETGDGEIILQYKKVEEPDSCTVGIENMSQNIGLQYVFNNSYHATATVLSHEQAIKITTEPPFSYIISSVDDNPNDNAFPGDFGLDQNHPNPFGSSTTIGYSLPEASFVKLNIYNINGELVRELHNGSQSAGKYSVEWNGLNDSGNPVHPGVYFYRLQTEKYLGTMKMFMVK